jgi:NitT/TauT family transport system substrate-binding protein
VVLLFASCASAPAAPQKLTVGITPYLSTAPVFIAQEEGFFAEQNLDVTFQSFENSALMTPALEQGQLDAVADSPAIGLFNAINTSGNIKIVADKGYLDPAGCTYSAILATPEWAANNPTPTADAIRGARISVSANSFSAFVLEKLLGTVGLTMDDVETFYLPPAALLEAAENGSVDFINTAEPWITRLVDTGKMVVWKGYQEIVPNMQVGFLDFGKLLIQDKPEIGERFLVAYLRGVREYNQGKTDKTIATLSTYTDLPAELLRQICWPPIQSDGSVHIAGLVEFQAWAVGKGLLDKVAAEGAIWEPRFIGFANQQLGAGNP